LVGRSVQADLDRDNPCQLPGIIAVFAVIGRWALNKHQFPRYRQGNS
jgi:hypothetical protein